MNLATILFILGILVVVLVAAQLFLVAFPILISMLGGLLWLALVIGGLYTCLTSNKPNNLKLLWVIIIILAPILGSLLWFLWGRRNT